MTCTRGRARACYGPSIVGSCQANCCRAAVTPIMELNPIGVEGKHSARFPAGPRKLLLLCGEYRGPEIEVLPYERKGRLFIRPEPSRSVMS